jgi:hypothetical protein
MDSMHQLEFMAPIRIFAKHGGFSNHKDRFLVDRAYVVFLLEVPSGGGATKEVG